MSELTFVFTDLHGCQDMFLELLSRCQSRADMAGVTDPLFVFLGDYVDRGPNSAGVIKTIREMEDTHQTKVIKGNHDVMMCNALIDGDCDLWRYNGMRETASSYGVTSRNSDEYLVEAMRGDAQAMDDAFWLEGLPYYYEDDLRFFVHAGIDPERSIYDQKEYDMVWIRGPFLHYRGRFPKYIVHGHSPHRSHPQVDYANRCNLDTGAYAYGMMTAGVFNNKQAGPIEFLYVTREELDKKRNDDTSLLD